MGVVSSVYISKPATVVFLPGRRRLRALQSPRLLPTTWHATMLADHVLMFPLRLLATPIYNQCIQTTHARNQYR